MSAGLFPLATKHWIRTGDRVCNSRIGYTLCKSLREKKKISKLEETLETGFPGGSVSKEPACNAGNCLQCRSRRFDPWVGKICWRRARQPTPVFLCGESPWTEEPGRLQSTGSQKSQT